MKVWFASDWQLPLSEVGGAAQRAERLGADCLALSDNLHDGTLGAYAAIQATRKITVATMGLVCFARSPMITAVAAWNLQAAAEGRFQLGLSSLVAPILSQKYGVPWEPPAPRMREYIAAVRAIFDCWQQGSPLNFVGKHYRVTRQSAYNSPPKLAAPEIPIHIGAIGPRMTELVGEIACGILTHPTNSTPRFVSERLLPSLHVGVAKANRSADCVAVVVNPPLALGSSAEEIRTRRESWRRLLAILFSTLEYGASLEMFGYDALGAQLRKMIREGQWNELHTCVSDELLDLFVLSSDYQGLPGLLRDQYQGLATGICLGLPQEDGSDRELGRAIEEIQHL